MKVHVTQENLNSALQLVSRVASRNTTLPILANILIRTSKNRLLLSATNLELAISEYIGAKVETEGDITIPARLFTEFVQNLPAGNVQLTAEDNSLHISAKNYSSTIHGITAADFPSIPDISGDPAAVLAGSELKQAINEVVHAASHDETRPVLTGVSLSLKNTEVTLTATDSYRLATKTLSDSTVAKETDLIVPSRSLQEMQRLISGAEKVALYIDEGQIKCVIDERELISRLVEGNYPEYQQLIPASSETSFDIDKEELLRITKIAGVFARDTAGSVRLKTDKAKSRLELSSVATQIGDNSSRAKIENVTNSDEITLNANYLIDALQVMPASKLNVSFSGKLAPCVLKPAGKKQTTEYIHIIMPLRS